MPESFALVAGHWYRFDRYELRDGVVRPAQGAKKEWYDPWANFRSERSRISEPPYTGLVELADRVEGAAGGWEGQLVAWCAAHGLLGIFHQRSLHAVLAPRAWGFTPLSVSRREYSRVTQTSSHLLPVPRWDERLFAENPAVSFGPTVRDGALAYSSAIPPHWPKPNVLTTDLTPLKSGYWEEPLSHAWGRFFPDVPAAEDEIYQYPNPMSEAFWKSYGEPINDFMIGARALRSAIEGLANVKRKVTRRHEQEKLDDEISMGWRYLNKLLSAVSPFLQFTDDEKPRLGWQAPSLLAHLALMVLLDVTEDRRIFRCEGCNCIAVARLNSAKYCSVTCREKMQKRRSRAGHPA